MSKVLLYFIWSWIVAIGLGIKQDHKSPAMTAVATHLFLSWTGIARFKQAFHAHGQDDLYWNNHWKVSILVAHTDPNRLTEREPQNKNLHWRAQLT